MHNVQGFLLPASLHPYPESRMAQEKVGIHSIRMLELRRHVHAVLGSFFSADRLLLEWWKQAEGLLECRFEIIYSDGYRLAGDYCFKRKGAARPALTSFVRASAARFGSEPGRAVASDTRSAAHWFLDRYETADSQ